MSYVTQKGREFACVTRSKNGRVLRRLPPLRGLISEALMSEIGERGLQTRRRILGDDHVDRAQHETDTLDQAFQTLITEAAWGRVWSSEAISDRERSMLTIALLAALGNFEELPMHIRATARTGASRTDVAEALQHVAIYAGVPRANHALKIAKAVYREMEEGE